MKNKTGLYKSIAKMKSNAQIFSVNFFQLQVICMYLLNNKISFNVYTNVDENQTSIMVRFHPRNNIPEKLAAFRTMGIDMVPAEVIKIILKD